MEVHLYALCWNEADMLGFFFRHYDPWIDRYVIFDDGSTDGSLELLRAHPRVELRRFERSHAGSFVASQRALQDRAWKASRGQADWVVVTAIDEHLWSPRAPMRELLAGYARRGITAAPALGFQMVSQDFPQAGETLRATRTRGAPNDGMSKLSIFDPDAVRHTNYTPGRHAALPLGDLRLPAHDEIRNLHYKYVGHARLIERQRTLHAGLGPLDHARRWGEQYGWEQQRTLAAYEHYAARAIDASDPALDTGRTHPSRWWRAAPEPIPAGPQTDAALHRHLWSGAEGYLDTARRGLAPDLDPEGDLAGARAAFGRLIGVPADAVAACAGLRQAGRAIARTLPRRSRVLAPDGDPTPLAPRRARRVPDLAAAIDARTSLVVLSAVRPDGTLADLGAVTAAARHHGARIALDATQACGWLPLDGSAYDHVACATHTWLLGPAGGAFVTGVATRAPACDWAAAQTSIELLDAIGIERIHTHAVALADRLRSRLGLPLGDTPIVPAPDGHWIAFHLYSGEADADALDGGALRREARGTRVRRQRTDWAPSP